MNRCFISEKSSSSTVSVALLVAYDGFCFSEAVTVPSLSHLNKTISDVFVISNMLIPLPTWSIGTSARVQAINSLVTLS